MSYQVLNKNLEGQMIEMKEKYKTIERNVQQVEALVHRGKKIMNFNIFNK